MIVKHKAQDVDEEHPRFLRFDNNHTSIDDSDGKIYATLWDWELDQTLFICEDENEPSGWFWELDTNESDREMVLEVKVSAEERETPAHAVAFLQNSDIDVVYIEGRRAVREGAA